jgi:hypothetical protein
MSSTKLGMIDSIIDGEDDQGGIIEAIPKEIRRSYIGKYSEYCCCLMQKSIYHGLMTCTTVLLYKLFDKRKLL